MSDQTNPLTPNEWQEVCQLNDACEANLAKFSNTEMSFALVVIDRLRERLGYDYEGLKIDANDAPIGEAGRNLPDNCKQCGEKMDALDSPRGIAWCPRCGTLHDSYGTWCVPAENREAAPPTTDQARRHGRDGAGKDER